MRGSDANNIFRLTIPITILLAILLPIKLFAAQSSNYILDAYAFGELSGGTSSSGSYNFDSILYSLAIEINEAGEVVIPNRTGGVVGNSEDVIPSIEIIEQTTGTENDEAKRGFNSNEAKSEADEVLDQDASSASVFAYFAVCALVIFFALVVVILLRKRAKTRASEVYNL